VDSRELLAAYDDQLRVDGELLHVDTREQHGPLWWAVFDGAHGFVTYRSLGGLAGPALDTLIGDTVVHFRDDTEVGEFEWKTRGHDAPADLGDRLRAAGLVAEEVETVMIGEATALAVDLELPEGVSLRRLAPGGGLLDDVRRILRMQDAVFGSPGGGSPESVAARITADPEGFQLWVAEAGDAVVCAGRLERVPGTEFAGIWGGATLPDWRSRGIYRALTAARAATALDQGVRFIHSDCTAMSRPILERSGLVAVTTTTPYVWRR
jgi:hypothetical protein